MRFRTKVDAWIMACVGFGVLAGAAGCWAAARSSGQWWIVPLVFGIDGLVSLMVWPCDYTLLDDRLIVRSGLVRYTVPYASIERVYATRNPLSSPAWSLDRLAVVYGGRTLLISPLERNEFLAGLSSRAGLALKGQELVRAG